MTESRTEGPLVPVNEAPVAADDAAQTTRNSPVAIDVLANDSDSDGDALTLSALTDPARGSATITAAGRISYTPDADFVGTDTFTYTVQDGEGGSASATVTVTVTAPVNRPPNAVDDSATTDRDVSVAIDILANDSDPDGDALTFVAVTQAANGAVSIDGDGVVYVPNDGFTGTDSFTYTIADPAGLSATARVNVTVRPLNQPPIARDDNLDVFENSITIAVLANDSDPDGDALFVISTGAALWGTVVSNPDGTVTYTRTMEDNGSDAFTYTIGDGRGGTSTATVSLSLSTP